MSKKMKLEVFAESGKGFRKQVPKKQRTGSETGTIYLTDEDMKTLISERERV